MKQKWIPIALIGVAGAIALAAAEMTTVKSSSVTLRPTPDIYGKSIGEFKQGTTLAVIEKKGRFLKVSADGKEGWIREKDLEPQKSIAEAGATAQVHSSLAGAAEESAAGKNLGPNAETYAKSRGGDPKQIDALIERRNKLIDSGAFDQFAVEGKVGRQYGGK